MSILVENQIVMKKLSEIKPYARNPRKNNKTVELLCKVIPKVGFNVPLVIDENGIIVKGHARFAAAIRLGMEQVPCIITHADKEAIKADRIADNKISEFSEWVNDELLHELDMIDFDLDMSDFGFPSLDNDMEEFEADFSEDNQISDEDRKKLYMQFLEDQAKEQAKEVTFVTEQQIQNAEKRQVDVPAAPKKYYKCVCEKCGHVMFVEANVVWSPENGRESL